MSQLEEDLLDVEIVLNSRPLIYIEEDLQMSILTPNSPIYKSGMIPEDDPDNIIEKDIRKRAQFISTYKEAVWPRSKQEYPTSWRKR